MSMIVRMSMLPTACLPMFCRTTLAILLSLSHSVLELEGVMYYRKV